MQLLTTSPSQRISGATVYNSDELIRYEIEELENTREEVLDDIVSSMIDREWCQRDPYGLRKEEALSLSWGEFADQVKHHTRYIFLNLEEDKPLAQLDLDMIPIPKMLDRISFEISKMERDVNIVRILDAGSIIFRVRIHDKEIELSRAGDLGTVPMESAVYSNRMSPAGIPMFYGALDSETALKETIDTDKKNHNKVASIANFRTIENLTVLDLSDLPEVPSLFDSEKRHLRSSLIFLGEFVSRFSIPVHKNKLENIEYVPTQVFTEYIRHIYRDNEGNPIEGILYPSSKNKDGICCVLFIYNEQCFDKYQDQDKPIISPYVPNRRCLYLEGVERRSV